MLHDILVIVEFFFVVHMRSLSTPGGVPDPRRSNRGVSKSSPPDAPAKNYSSPNRPRIHESTARITHDLGSNLTRNGMAWL